MREIVLDTETTGIDPRKGHRLIEIGCVELYNRIPTGREYHCFINPERDVPSEAEAIHGLSSDFLKDKPVFSKVANDFIAFIGDAGLVIHNAAFDIGFLNFELDTLGLSQLSFDRVVDTLALARRRHPAGPNTLDALCKRYNIDNSKRIKHGALMDSLLLAKVYVELLGERQAALSLQSNSAMPSAMRANGARVPLPIRREPLEPRLTQVDIKAHRAFIEGLGTKALWLKFWQTSEAEDA